MKSKRAEEFIRNSAFSAIQLPGEVMYSIHMNVEGKLLDRKSAERAVELAEQDAEEKIEALKARTVEVFKRCCIYRSKSEDSDSCFLNDQYNTCDNNCSKVKLLIQKLNDL